MTGLWTHEPPTRAGWFWAVLGHAPQVVRVAEQSVLDGDPGALTVFTTSEQLPQVDLGEVGLWGPQIQEPAAPLE